MQDHPQIKKVGIVVNRRKESASILLAKLQDWLNKRDIRVTDTTNDSWDTVIQDSGLLICLGGDGTLLSLAHRVKETKVPILGVNLGSLGFLTEVKQDEVFEELTSFLNGSAKIEERLMLSCFARSERNKHERRFVALNDIVFSREGLSRMLYVDVRVRSEKITRFAGDGLIVSTPTGSTAYSLSAGGAVVHPNVAGLLITPICPHASALRSLIVDANEKIIVRITSHEQDEKAVLTADGQENIEIDDSYIVEITRSSNALHLVKSSKRSYFETLRENFKFPE